MRLKVHLVSLVQLPYFYSWYFSQNWKQKQLLVRKIHVVHKWIIKQYNPSSILHLHLNSTSSKGRHAHGNQAHISDNTRSSNVHLRWCYLWHQANVRLHRPSILVISIHHNPDNYLLTIRLNKQWIRGFSFWYATRRHRIYMSL